MLEVGVAVVLAVCVGVAGLGGVLALLGVADLDRDCDRRIRVGGVGTLIPPSSPISVGEHSSESVQGLSTGGFSWSISSSPLAGVEVASTGWGRGSEIVPWSSCRCIVHLAAAVLSHWTFKLGTGT